MPAWEFARSTILNSASPACLWRHPGKALRLAWAAAGNALSPLQEGWLPARHACPVCGWEGRSFRSFLSADEVLPACICPGCGSFDRHRLLAVAVRSELDDTRAPKPRVLVGFSLSAALRLLLEKEGAGRCFRSDVDPGDLRFDPDLVTDLRDAGLRDGVVDWVLCNHVLEHVGELDACLAEIARVLAPGGLAWIQVPQEEGLAVSLRQEIDPHRSHAHAWRFGDDFDRLIRRPDWDVRRIEAADLLPPVSLARFGIAAEERYWLARKT